MGNAGEEVLRLSSKGTDQRKSACKAGTTIKGAEFTTPMGIAYCANDKSLVISDLEERLVRILIS